jgi:hypothetical protein
MPLSIDFTPLRMRNAALRVDLFPSLCALPYLLLQWIISPFSMGFCFRVKEQDPFDIAVSGLST